MPTFSRLDPPSTRQLARDMVIEEQRKAEPQIGNKGFGLALLIAVLGFAALIYLLL